MPGLDESPHERPPVRYRGAVRLLVAGAIGCLTTAILFVAMALLIDPTALIERLIRIFPLIQVELPKDESCDESGLMAAVTIEGVVVGLRGGTLQPLPGLEVLGDDRVSEPIQLDVASDGSFRFATAFPGEAPSPCDGKQPPKVAATQQLIIRAPTCTERKVPITKAWVPHPITLNCAPPDQLNEEKPRASREHQPKGG